MSRVICILIPSEHFENREGKKFVFSARERGPTAAALPFFGAIHVYVNMAERAAGRVLSSDGTR